MSVAGTRHVNFSPDFEGAELSVLMSIDFDVFSFDVLVLEADKKNMQQYFTKKLEIHGYVLYLVQ